jgi:hypothetical protein
MPKKYFCETVTGIDGLDVCGETEPNNFSPGRYNKCRKCRNLEVRKYQQRLKEESERENMESRTEDIKDGKKILMLIESVIKGKALTEEGLTIPEDLVFIKNKMNDISKGSYNFFIQNDQEIKRLKDRNKFLEEKVEKMEAFLEKKFENYNLK